MSCVWNALQKCSFQQFCLFLLLFHILCKNRGKYTLNRGDFYCYEANFNGNHSILVNSCKGKVQIFPHQFLVKIPYNRIQMRKISSYVLDGTVLMMLYGKNKWKAKMRKKSWCFMKERLNIVQFFQWRVAMLLIIFDREKIILKKIYRLKILNKNYFRKK